MVAYLKYVGVGVFLEYIGGWRRCCTKDAQGWIIVAIAIAIVIAGVIIVAIVVLIVSIIVVFEFPVKSSISYLIVALLSVSNSFSILFDSPWSLLGGSSVIIITIEIIIYTTVIIVVVNGLRLRPPFLIIWLCIII
jgi:hypothetical protein